MTDILEQIRLANMSRKMKQLPRRLLKLSEEKGEVSEAFLSVTSKNNKKNKSWDDVREELTDVTIVAMDLLWMSFPDEAEWTVERKREEIDKWFAAKLNKWQKKIDSGDSMDFEQE